MTTYTIVYNSDLGLWEFEETNGGIHYVNIRNHVYTDGNSLIVNTDNINRRVFQSGDCTNITAADAADLVDKASALIPVASTLTDPSERHFCYYARNGNGHIEMDGILSSGITPWRLTPPSNTTYKVKMLIGHLAAAPSFDLDRYGRLNLQNGILFRYVQNSVTYDLLDNNPVFTWADWMERCYDINYYAGGGGDDDRFTFRWVFASDIVLRGDDGDYIEILPRDNFSSVNIHRYIFQGTETVVVP